MDRHKNPPTREIVGREREGGKEGPERLRYRAGKREGGGNCILYTIMSRLHQHLEVISMGRRVDLAALQRMQNRAMRWVRGEGMRAFRTEAALESLAWLDVGQTAAKVTIMTALKVLREGKQEDLVDRLAKRDKRGDLKVKNVSKAEFLGMSSWMRKAWSTRARRWLS